MNSDNVGVFTDKAKELFPGATIGPIDADDFEVIGRAKRPFGFKINIGTHTLWVSNDECTDGLRCQVGAKSTHTIREPDETSLLAGLSAWFGTQREAIIKELDDAIEKAKKARTACGARQSI